MLYGSIAHVAINHESLLGEYAAMGCVWKNLVSMQDETSKHTQREIQVETCKVETRKSKPSLRDIRDIVPRGGIPRHSRLVCIILAGAH